MIRGSVIPYVVGVVTVVATVFGLYVFIEAALYTPLGDTAGATAPAVFASSSPAVTATSSATATATTPATTVLFANLNKPSRLVIPSLSINANVQTVGLTAKSAVGAPSNFTDVAWYIGSSVPGNPGSAIIDGHVDNGLGLAGVFKHLNTIQTGAAVEIITKSGTTLNFTVTNVSVYDYQNVPMTEFLSNSGTPTLRLITCDGDWIGSQRTYNERLVITATLQQ